MPWSPWPSSNAGEAGTTKAKFILGHTHTKDRAAFSWLLETSGSQPPKPASYIDLARL